MNTWTICARWLLDARRALLGWGLGLISICLLYLPLFPSMRDSGLIGDKLAVMPQGMIDSFGMDIVTISTGWGYTHQMIFGMLGLLLMLVLGISTGAAAIAGDEESGSLEMTLAHATDRRALISARLVALLGIVLGMTALLALTVAAFSAPSQLGLTAAGLLGEGLALGLLTALHALTAFAAGAAGARRAVASSLATLVGICGWFLHHMGGKVADWLPQLSPFHWAYGATPLRHGVDMGGLALLGAVCLMLIAVSYLLFERRDLRA
ncbi:hypothetical protein KEM60_00339 [Austwickia sp. TVS 96-490-7B]|uniref:ABC transporter permease subunit n=1 Tax=Austwickia sp. TVS 96-490-7B TaxID=2830843 RepID=UPI001C579811|nr:ABC transporter permease subunit [Austwickia sp. TVS 96-490-7B]MBW3084155.1 hypothetical protein [Austwickia sp. TVS 96-490-7B]